MSSLFVSITSASVLYAEDAGKRINFEGDCTTGRNTGMHMGKNRPPSLIHCIHNDLVLEYLKRLSAHSDVSQALMEAVKPLGDVETFCPDPKSHGYLIVHTKGMIFGFATGMNEISFRLSPTFRQRAIETGGKAHSSLDQGWVRFEAFRSDWPKTDFEFWAVKAYVFAREPQA